MSQRDGPPQSVLSAWLLRFMGCCLCSDENEWGGVWNTPRRGAYGGAPEVGEWVPKHRRSYARSAPSSGLVRDVVVVNGRIASVERW